MNITTHGKDGPKISFLEAEKRRFIQVLSDLEFLSSVAGEIGSRASQAYQELELFVVASGIVKVEPEEAYKAHTAIGDQHREEDQQAAKQGAGK